MEEPRWIGGMPLCQEHRLRWLHTVVSCISFSGQSESRAGRDEDFRNLIMFHPFFTSFCPHSLLLYTGESGGNSLIHLLRS